MLAYLKIKIVSLAAEATLIRNEERKHARRITKVYTRERGSLDPHPNTISNEIYWGLRNHRQFDVASEARAALIAYGYLRGKSYAAIEGLSVKEGNEPNWTRVYELVAKYGKRTKAVLKSSDIDSWAKVPPTNSETDRRSAALDSFFAKKKASREFHQNKRAA